MAHGYAAPPSAAEAARIRLASMPAYQAFRFLHVAFIAIPIVAGLDKFFNWLVPWEVYLAPTIANLMPLDIRTSMMIGGAIEIAAGLLVAFRPKIGGAVVGVWLWAIIVNLLLVPGFYDIALRDFGLSLGALALSRLAAQFERVTIEPDVVVSTQARQIHEPVAAFR